MAGPLIESSLAAFGSLAIGLPLGVGLGMLAVRVLGLFFALRPPLLTLPIAALATLAALVVSISAAALGLALRQVGQPDVAASLRAP